MRFFARPGVRAIVAVVSLGGIAIVSDVRHVSAANGSRIAFEGDRFSSWGLAAMNPDGSGVVDLLAPYGGADAAWSPNGQQIAFEADRNGDDNLEIYLMNADGTNVRQITDQPGRDFWPAWFPNGRQIAFTSLRTGVPNIWVMNVDGSHPRPLTTDTEIGNFEPHVSPSGKHVVFVRAARGGLPSIWAINSDGTGLVQLTEEGPSDVLGPQFSPDGRHIVFSSNGGGTYEIYLMDADGTHLTQLTAAPGADFNPTFSPDGRQIAWWKLRFGQGDVWVMNSDGSGQVNLTDTPDFFEGFPDWHQGRLGR